MAETRPAPPRQSLTAKVIEALRHEIESGAYRPGDKLPTEPALIERFGVSRTVVREAIAAMRADGLVESRHGVGVFVLEPRTEPDTLDLPPLTARRISDVIEELELRAAVEIEAAGLAARRASPAQEAEIIDRYHAFSDLVLRGEPTSEADYAFHIAIARATNNARFEGFLAQLGRRTIPREKLHGALGAAGAVSRDTQLDAEHREVAEAIARHDAEGARAAMRAHLLGSLERYRNLAQKVGATRAP